MDIINELAQDFIKQHDASFLDYNELINDLKYKLHDLNRDKDKIQYLEIIRNQLITDLKKHDERCKKGSDCETSKNFNKSIFYIDQELESLGIKVLDGLFTEMDKLIYDSKLDEILDEIEKLRKGQEIIYDDLYNEIQELKSLYFLNKKNWNQLLVGKLTELTINGLNQEIVNRILQVVNPEFSKLLK